MDIKFVVALNYLEIKSNLGRGDKITDEMYISNDSSILKNIIYEESKNVIGILEYKNLLNSKVFIYASEKLPENIDINNYILKKLYAIQMFLSAIWVYQDHNINYEIGFAFLYTKEGIRTNSNSLPVIYSMSEGQKEYISLSRENLKKIREFYRSTFKYKEISINNIKFTQLLKGTLRVDMALYHIIIARSYSDIGLKISSYCSALETLFSTNQAELSHQLSERLAFFIGTNNEERIDLYRNTKKAYGIRSKIVHGSCIDGKNSEIVKELSKFCDISLRRALHKIMVDKKIKEVFDGKNLDIDNYMLNLIFDIKV